MKIKKPLTTSSLNVKPSALPPKAQSLAKAILEADRHALVDVLRVPISDSLNGPNTISEEASTGGFYLWTYGRSDLSLWSDVLDKFDDILTSIITSYGICSLTEPYNKDDLCFQQRPFEAHDLDLTLSILMFSKILLENSTSLHHYSSADRLICLLMTDEVGILELCLQLLLTGYKRRRNMLFDSPLVEILEVFTNHVPPPTDLSQLDPQRPGCLITDTPETCKYVSTQERLYRAHSLRASQYPGQFELVRLYALSLLLYAYEARSNDLFRMFPTLISDTARLIGPRGTDVEAAAMRFASHTLRFDIKWDELHYALQVDSINGPLMSIMRRILEEPASYSPSYLIAFFELFTGVVSNAFFDASLVAANFVDVLVRAVTAPLFDEGNTVLMDRKVYRIRERLLGSLDTLIRRGAAFSDAFFTSDGLHQIIQLACSLITFLIDHPASICRHALSTYLTQLLRLIDRLLTTRTDDRMRNMIDGPIFRSLKVLFESYKGADKDSSLPPLLFTKAMAVLADYVHNEPTCLSILQEQGVTTSLLHALTREHSIVPEPEMLRTTLHAFGALCLNPVGYEEFKRVNPFAQFMKIFKDPQFRYAMGIHSLPMQLGVTLDEFCRHHPQLRGFIFEHIVDTIKAFSTNPDPQAMETLGCKLHVEALDLPSPLSLDEVLWYLPSRVVLFQALCTFLEALLRSPGHAKEFHEQHEGVKCFLEVLKAGHVFHYHFCIEQVLSSTVSLLRSLSDSAAEIIIDGLVCLLDHNLNWVDEDYLYLRGRSGRFSFRATPFHDLKFIKVETKIFEGAFKNICQLLACLSITHDLYFSPNFSSPAIHDIVSRFWTDEDKGDKLPGMSMTAHNLSVEYYQIVTDPKCKQLLGQSIEVFDGHNPDHVNALNLHTVIFLHRHIPSQVTAIWSTLIKRLCAPAVGEGKGSDINKSTHKSVGEMIVTNGVVGPLETIPEVIDSPAIKQCAIMNILTVMNAILFDETSHKIQANAEVYELVVSVDGAFQSLDEALTAALQEDTPCRLPLLHSLLLWFTRVTTPAVYKSAFWSALGDSPQKPIDKLLEGIAKWTLVIVRTVIEHKDALGPNTLSLLPKLLSNLTLQHRSPTQGSSMEASPGESEFLHKLRDLRSPSNSPSESFRTLFHDMHDLILPLSQRFMQEILTMPEQIQRYMTQELVNNILCRYESFGWNGHEFISQLIPEIFPHSSTPNEIPLPIRMNVLVLLLHTTNKVRLLAEIAPCIPCLVQLLKNKPDARDTAAIVLTEYVALQSLPPTSKHSSTDINDPSFDGGIKRSTVQDYEWQLPPPDAVDHKSAFEDALLVLQQPDLTPSEVNAFLRLVIACLKTKDISYTPSTLIPTLLKHAPKSVFNKGGSLLETKTHNSIPHLISLALRLMAESHVNLQDYLQLDLVSKYSAGKMALKEGVELNLFVLDSKASILRDWRAWLEAAKASLVARIPPKSVLRAEKDRQAIQGAMPAGLVHLHLREDLKQADITARILADTEAPCPVMNVLVELASNSLRFYPVTQYLEKPLEVAESQLDFMCLIGNITELAAAYPNCHLTLVDHDETEELLSRLIIHASFNSLDFDPRQEDHPVYLDSFDSARNCWLHLLLHTILFGSIFDRSPETKKKLSSTQVGWCRLVVEALESAWSSLESETDANVRLGRIHGMSTIVSILLDINNPQVGFNDLPDNFGSFARRQSAVTMMLAAQMIERNMVSILSRHLEYVSGLSYAFHKLHLAVYSTIERISEALELLSKLGSRLGRMGREDLGSLTSKLTTMNSLDFSLDSEDSRTSSGSLSDDTSMTDSMSMDSMDEGSMTESQLDMDEDYGYEGELQSEGSSMDDDDDDDNDSISIVEMSIDGHDEDSRHVTFDILSSDGVDDDEDSEDSDSEVSFQRSRIPPGILEDAVMQVLQRSGINPAEAPVDIILEQQEDEDNEYEGGRVIRGFYGEDEEADGYDSYDDDNGDDWETRSYEEEEEASEGVDRVQLYDGALGAVLPAFDMHQPLTRRMRGAIPLVSPRSPRNVYAGEVFDRPSYHPWANPTHSALEVGARPNPIPSPRQILHRPGLAPITFDTGVAINQLSHEIYPHPSQYSTLPPQYLDLLTDPMRSVRQSGMSLFLQTITKPSDSTRYRLADIEPGPIKWPEVKPVKHPEVERSLEQALITPTHRRWIQLDQVLYSLVTHLQTSKSIFIFDNPSLPYIPFSSGLVVSLVPMLREAVNARELEASAGFTDWSSFTPNGLPRSTEGGTHNHESSHTDDNDDNDDDDEHSLTEESETAEERLRALTTMMEQVTGRTSSTLVYEDAGIDVSFIEAMPFDLLGEAFQQHFSERRRSIRALREENDTQDWPRIHISEAFLGALAREMQSMYERMSNEDDIASRLFGHNEEDNDEDGDDFGEAASHDHDEDNDTPRDTSRASRPAASTATASTDDKKQKEKDFEGLPLADPSVLTSILGVHYHPGIARPRSLFRSLLHFCSNRRTRENLLGLLLFILQKCPVDDEALQGILGKFVKRQASTSPNASGSASRAPSTPRGKEGSQQPAAIITSPVTSPSGTFSQRQVVILQRTLQLLMQLVQRTPEIQDFFVQEDHADSWSIKRHWGKREPVLTTKSPLVVLLAVIENPVFMRIVNEAGPSGSMVLELLLHLIAIVAEKVEKSTTCPEVPPFFLQVFARCLASPTELTPRAQAHAIHVLQRLTKHPALATPLISEIASLANGSLLDSTVQCLGDEQQALDALGTPSEHLLRLMKLFSSMLFARSSDQVDSIQAHLTSLESLPSLRQVLLNPSWRALSSGLSHRMSLLEVEESRSLPLVATLLPALEAYFLQVRLLLAILKQLGGDGDVGGERSAVESDLIQFAEGHRRSLNFLIQANPSLLTSGSFHLLAAHPRFLDFDNKRILFKQQLHRKPPNSTFPGITLNIRRQYVFEDSFHQLISRTGEEVKFGKLTVKFHGEEGVDVGGVTREWFSVLTRAMFNPDYALFKTSASDRITYQPNRLSSVNPDHLQFFRFVGRVIGKAIYDSRLLDAYFTRSFYKHMLGQSPDFRDLEAVDPEFHKSLTWTLEHDITGVLDWTFSVETEEFGQTRVIDLLDNGHNIPVTEANKREYVRAMTEYRLTTAIKPQIEAFLTGFREIVPEELLKIFSDSELELLISGMPDLDVEDWRAHTHYHGSYSPSTPVIQWFWRAVRNFEPEDRAKLLQFVTGTSKVPMEGFAGLQGSGGVERFQIHKVSGDGQHRLPTAHTCFNQLDLPEYASYEELREALLLAISECSTGFGFV